MKTAEVIKEEIALTVDLYGGDSLIDELLNLIQQAQQEAFEEGRDRSLDWAADTVCHNSYLYTKEAHSQSILNGKQATELQYETSKH